VERVLRFSQGDQQNGFSLTAMGYSGRWNSTDQVPERAISSGLINRFGSIDSTDAGRTHRYTLGGEWRTSTGAGLTLVKAYAIDYGLDLFSNFTYFLDDPCTATSSSRRTSGISSAGSVSQRFLSHWFGKDTESVAGFQGRFDHIQALASITLRPASGSTPSARIGRPVERRLYFQSSIQWTSKLRTVAGVRGTSPLRRRERRPSDTGTRGASLASPKLSVILGPWRSTEVYANWGWGFHSNDARGSVQTRDPKTGDPVLPVDPIVRAKGAEIGVRTLALHRFPQHRDWLAARTSPRSWCSSEMLGRPSPVGPSRVSASNGRMSTPLHRGSPWTPTSRIRRRASATRIRSAIGSRSSRGRCLGRGDRRRARTALGSLRLRYFGPRPLIEDDGVRSKSSTTLNARVAYRLSRRYSLAVEAFNLTNASVSDIDYYYASRLQGEPDGVNDIHTQPAGTIHVSGVVHGQFSKDPGGPCGPAPALHRLSGTSTSGGGTRATTRGGSKTRSRRENTLTRGEAEFPAARAGVTARSTQQGGS